MDAEFVEDPRRDDYHDEIVGNHKPTNIESRSLGHKTWTSNLDKGYIGET